MRKRENAGAVDSTTTPWQDRFRYLLPFLVHFFTPLEVLHVQRTAISLQKIILEAGGGRTLQYHKLQVLVVPQKCSCFHGLLSGFCVGCLCMLKHYNCFVFLNYYYFSSIWLAMRVSTWKGQMI
jgi:hypothetical protein